MRRAIITIILLIITKLAFAEKPQIKFKTRIIFDSSISGYDPNFNTQYLYSLEDFRVGFVAAIKDVTIKADIGVSKGGLAVKDLYVNYNMKNSHISIGNSYKPFSLEMLTSTLDMSFTQVASAPLAFGDSRNVGISYNLDLPNLYLATGIFSDNDINSIKKFRSNAISSTSRVIVRFRDDSDNLFHFGGSFAYITPSKDNNGELNTKTISSIGVINMFGESVALAELNSAGAKATGVVEGLAIFSKWRIQSEYFMNRVVFDNSQQLYHPDGGYVQAGFLLLGRGYNYDTGFAILSRPKNKRALELTARYSYINLNDYSSNVLAGSHQDLSLGLNYYINDYFAAKLSGSYLKVGDHCTLFYSSDQLIAQLRLQFSI